MGREIDLNAGARAQGEVTGEPPVLIYGEPPQRFTLVPRLGARFLAELEDNRVWHAIRCVFPDEGEAQRFLDLEPDLRELVAMADIIASEYLGMNLGEPVASDSSSTQDSESSRQPSKSDTA